jgi:hypothetical protein
MRTIEVLSLANVTQLGDEEFLLTLQVNQTPEEHTVKYTTEFWKECMALLVTCARFWL